jgi:protein-S-isoprenylcysteine O-methyltransferase Ste14
VIAAVGWYEPPQPRPIGSGPAVKWQSIAAFGAMVAGLVWLLMRHEVLARSAPAIGVQVAAAALMVWARLTFGLRSFHAAANPTGGGLVTTGPYRWLRHPIYAAIVYFMWSTAIDHRSLHAFAAAGLITAGAAVRMYAEETLLVRIYPDYLTYRARTARVVPFIL